MRMIPVGTKNTSILFIPRTTTESFLTWDFNDPRFRQWQLDCPDPLERLKQSERREDIGTREKHKASGRARDLTTRTAPRDKAPGVRVSHRLEHPNYQETML